MIDHCTKYARLVVAGKRKVSKAEFNCCQRHLKDIERSKSRDFPYKFDVKESEYHLKIANTLTIIEGAEPKILKTRGFQDFIIGNIFGWRSKRKENGHYKRRYREAYVSMGRQNGKSFLAGVLANDFATFSGYREGKIFCTATKQDQANIVWDEVRKFIEGDPDLEDLYTVKKYKHEIISRVTNSVIKSIGRDTKTTDGFRSILAIIDEYHLHPTNQMYRLMLDGQVTVDSPLTIAITTAGFNLNYPCYEQYKMAKQVAAGLIDYPTLFVYIAEAEIPDPRKDEEGYNRALRDPDNWLKANPLIGWANETKPSHRGIAKIKSEAAGPLIKGGHDLLDFVTKRLNIWVTNSEDAFLDSNAWDATGVDMTLEDMRGRGCFVGVDLSEGGDLTSISFVFPLDGGKVFVDSHSFIPRESLIHHEATDLAPYRAWVNEGLLTSTDGAGTYGYKTDYKGIIKYLKDIREKYNIKYIECGYDNRNAAAFLTDLDEALGCDLTEVIQSAKSLNDATKDLQLSIKAKTVLHSKKNQLLTWSMLNATTVTNVYNEIKVDKTTRAHRIDPVDALVDAWKCYFTRHRDEADANDVAADWAAGFNC